MEILNGIGVKRLFNAIGRFMLVYAFGKSHGTAITGRESEQVVSWGTGP